MAHQEDSSFGLQSLGDSDSSLFFDETDFVALSDDGYGQDLQFQETPMASVITSHNASSSKSVEVSRLASKIEQIDFTAELDADDLLIICEICAEAKETNVMFTNQRCGHSFCYDCVTKQVAAEIQDNISVVPCPALKCKGVFDLDACRPMLSKDLIDRWDNALCEALLLNAPKLYCPFRDCSAMMLDDNEGQEIRESECPFCHRLFCARCHVPWHPGVSCEDFQKHLLVRELAHEKKWSSRCPQCKFNVENTEGYLHMICGCGFHFCYVCGKEWTSAHGGCQRK